MFSIKKRQFLPVVASKKFNSLGLEKRINMLEKFTEQMDVMIKKNMDLPKKDLEKISGKLDEIRNTSFSGIVALKSSYKDSMGRSYGAHGIEDNVSHYRKKIMDLHKVYSERIGYERNLKKDSTWRDVDHDVEKIYSLGEYLHQIILSDYIVYNKKDRYGVDTIIMKRAQGHVLEYEYKKAIARMKGISAFIDGQLKRYNSDYLDNIYKTVVTQKQRMYDIHMELKDYIASVEKTVQSLMNYKKKFKPERYHEFRNKVRSHSVYCKQVEETLGVEKYSFGNKKESYTVFTSILKIFNRSETGLVKRQMQEYIQCKNHELVMTSRFKS